MRFAWTLGPLLLLACATPDPAKDDAPSKEDDFAVGQVSAATSILPAIENSGGKIEVCVGLIGFERGQIEIAKKKVTSSVTDTANAWNTLLAGNALWTLQTAVAPVFRFQESECAKNLPGFAVNVWGTAEGFKADYCSRPNYTCSSGAIGAYRSLYLGPWNRTQAEDAFKPFTMLHEYGHLLGMGDTYRIPNANDWNGEQPASIMNGQSQRLTDDDKLGLWVVVRTLKTGVRSCEGFGAEVPMTANAWGALMCDPAAKPEEQHGNPVPAVQAVLPREGTWGYQGYDPKTTAVRIRAVKRTDAGFTMMVAAVTNGQPAASESMYLCDPGGTCVAQTDRSYRMLVASATSMRMINQSVPAGLQVDLVR